MKTKLLLISLFTLFVFYSCCDDEKKTIQLLSNENSELNDKIEKLEMDIYEKDNHVEELESENDELKEKLDEAALTTKELNFKLF